MEKRWFLIVIIMALCLAFFISLLFIPTMDVSAQTFNCTVRREVEIPYQFEYFETRIRANTAFEIKFTIRDNSNEKVYVRLIPGTEDPAVTVDDKTLTFHLGSGLYSSTKTNYEVIGSSDDDFEIPGFSRLFLDATILEEDWVYEYDGGQARITDITISSDQARIKYIEFWDTPERDANKHWDSQDFEDFSDLDDADWENLSPNTGAPSILSNEDVLYLTSVIPSGNIPSYYPYPYPYYPPYYSSLYPSFSGSPTNVYNIYYGNYPGRSYSTYPSGPFASFRGNFPGVYYQGYSSLYPGSYTGSFQNLLFGGYPGSYYSSYSFTNPAGGYNAFPAPFLGFGSFSPRYGVGYPLYGGFI